MIANTSFQRTFRFKNEDDGEIIDLSGYSAQIHIRASVGNDSSVIALNSESATANGSTITIDGEAGEVEFLITPNETKEFATSRSDKRLFWDLRLIDGEGFVTVYFRASNFIIKPVSSRDLS
jgi:hypothetical protein